MDRAFLSNLIQKIAAHHPAAIESDFLLDQPTEPAKDQALAKTLRDTKVPLVISYVADPSAVTPEQKAFEDAMVPPDLRAMANEPTDQFDTARYVYPGEVVNGHYIPGVARAVAAKLGIKTPAVQVPIIWHGVSEIDPDTHEPKFFKQYSAATAAFMPDSWYRGKIVLIGSDVTLVDRHRTPFSVFFAGEAGQLPGIVIQAHALSQLIHHKVSPVMSWQFNYGVTLALAFLGAALGVISASLVWRAVGLVLFLPLFWAGGVALYHYANVMVGLMSPALAMVASFASMESLSGREARKQKQFIQGAFSRYVSPAVVDRMVADPARMSLEGERREMTFLFSDIADFTTMSEKIEAIQLAHVLNSYLDGMTNLVMKHGGMVDKFIGDAVFAIFNAPAGPGRSSVEGGAMHAGYGHIQPGIPQEAACRRRAAGPHPHWRAYRRGGGGQFRQPCPLHLYGVRRCGEHRRPAGGHQQVFRHKAVRLGRDQKRLQGHQVPAHRLGHRQGQDRSAGSVGATA